MEAKGSFNWEAPLGAVSCYEASLRMEYISENSFDKHIYSIYLPYLLPQEPDVHTCPIAFLIPPSNTSIVWFIPIPLAIANCSMIRA